MLQQVVDYFNRYKRPIFIVSGIASFVYFASSYTKHKLKQFQDDATKFRLAKENLKKRFQKNCEDTEAVIKELLTLLKTTIQSELNVENMVEQARELRSNEDNKLLIKEAKLKIWENIKLTTFTRLLTYITLINLTSLFCTIQLNLIGRLLYIESVIGPIPLSKIEDSTSTSTTTLAKMSYENEKLYLSFSWWFLHRGYQKLLNLIQLKVEEKVNNISLKQQFNFGELVELLMDLKDSINYQLLNNNNNNNESLLNILLPKDFESECEVLSNNGFNLLPVENIKNDDINNSFEEMSSIYIDKDLRRLLNETKDFIECKDFEELFQSNQTLLLETYLKNLKPNFYPTLKPSSIEEMETKMSTNLDFKSSPLLELNESTLTHEIQINSLPLAKLLPMMNTLSLPILNLDQLDYIEVLVENPKLKAFAAIVYSSFMFLDD